MSFAVVAQNSAMLIGDWFYQAPVETGKLDAKGRQMLDMIFGEMSFSFAKDGAYTANFMGKEDSGKWTMNSAATAVTLVSASDPEATIKVLTLTATEWQMEIGEGKGFVFGRSPRE